MLSSSSMPLIVSMVTASVAGFTSYLCYYYYYSASLTSSNRDVKSTKKSNTNNNILTSLPLPFESCPYTKELKVAIQLAYQCGNNIHQYCYQKGCESYDPNKKNDNSNLMIQTKGQPEDFCTIVDLQNEKIVMDGIRQHFPSHEIIGEESVGTGMIPPINPTIPTWIVDPIDGTTNFVSGIPLTCVSIGLCINAIPTVGVIYAPMTNELYIGVKGYGAYRNGIRILHRSEIIRTTTTTKLSLSLKDSVIGFEFGYVRDPKGITKMITTLQNIMLHGCRTVRSLGSGVLDLLYVATGRLDLVYAGVATEGWKPWDYCAASVIVQEAGCIIESLYNDKNDDVVAKDNNSETKTKTTTTTTFDIYSKSVICAIDQSLIDEFRQHILSPSQPEPIRSS
jgi:fructose-1,6-bisphosphatase/inositol monophosphatase family enzyme